jgi:putative transposase
MAGPGAALARSAGRVNGVLTAVRSMVAHAVAAGQADGRLVPLLYEVADDRDLPAAARDADGRMAWRLRARHRLHEPEAPVDRASDEQVVALLAACRSARDRLIVLLMARAGLRRGELCGLRRSDVHLVADSRPLGCGVARAHLHVIRREGNPNGAWAKSRRPKTSPGATAAGVAAEIVRLRKELAPDNGADAIIAALGPVAARDGWAERAWRVPHRSTVNKILKRAGLVKDEPRKRPRSSFRRFAYARPRDCYQVDATEVKLADGTAAMVFEVLDDCTRLLAACRAAAAETAAGAVAAIRTAAAACGAPGIVLCDNGPTFTGGPRARGAGASAFSRAVAALGARLIHSSPYHRPAARSNAPPDPQALARHPARPRHPGTAAGPAGRLPPLLQHPPLPLRGQDHPAARLGHRPRPGRPGRLPCQDDATVHALTVRPNGTISLCGLDIYISTSRAGTKITAIRDHDRVTAYTPADDPLGHIRLDHDKHYQSTITPAA